MRDLQEIADRLSVAREEWTELQFKRQGELDAMGRRMRDARYSEMCTLGWVLGIDVHAATAPLALPSGVEPVTQVTVTHLETVDWWYVEFPATSSSEPPGEHPLWPMQYWATVLTTRQIRQLAAALLGAYAKFRQSASGSAGRNGRKVPILMSHMVLPISLPVADLDAVEQPLLPPA